MLFKPSEAMHSNSFPAPATSLIVEVDESTLANDLLSDYMKTPRQESAATVQRLLFTIRSEIRTRAPLSELIIQACILELLGRLARANDTPSNKDVDTALDYIRDNVSRNISLADIASVTALPAPRLARDFKKITGLSIGDYLRRYRVDLGITALAQSSRTVSRIGAELGFSDHSHFTRVFKQVTGMTPADFRLMNQ